MKQHLNIAHEGTATGERTRMRLHEAATVKLMSMFTDLYSDRALAVIREYSTNAWDSHVAAGIDDPIEVHLPNDMKPTFVVKDHGVGLSVDEVTDLYTAYGYSSKDQSDDFTGMLGLGSKSGLTYTSQFTVKAVKDGRQTLVLVTRDSDGCGVVQVMDERDTLDPNGFEVQIPVTNVSEFNRKAENFYRFWAPGTVTVNGKAPASVFDPNGPYEARLLDPDVAVFSAHGSTLGSDYVVMGNVPYPVNYEYALGKAKRDKWGDRIQRQYVVARVPIGTVEIVPSREALDYTKLTRETLADIAVWAAHHQETTALADVEAQPTKGDALTAVLRWRGAGINLSYTYKGQDVPKNFPVKRNIHWEGTDRSRPSSTGNAQTIQTETALRAIHVLGFKGSRLNPTTKAKTIQYLSEKGISIGRGGLFFYETQPHLDWLPAANVVDISDIRAVVLKDANKPVVRQRSKYRVLDSYGDTYDYDSLDDCYDPYGDPTDLRTCVVVDSTIRNKEYLSALGTFARDNKAFVAVVTPSKRRWFFENHTCIDHKTFLGWHAKKSLKGCTPAWVKYRQFGDRAVSGLSYTDADAIHDPDLTALIEDADLTPRTHWSSANLDRVSRVLEAARKAGVMDLRIKLPKVEDDGWQRRAEQMYRRYPILKVTNSEYRYDPHYGRSRYVDLVTEDQRVELVNALYYARAVDAAVIAKRYAEQAAEAAHTAAEAAAHAHHIVTGIRVANEITCNPNPNPSESESTQS